MKAIENFPLDDFKFRQGFFKNNSLMTLGVKNPNLIKTDLVGN